MPFVNDGFEKQDPAGAGGVGGSTNASDLTSGTLADARLSSGILNATYQHNQYVLTTGTSTAYVATPTVAIVLADGVEILCGIHTTSGLNPTLNVSGTGAKAIYKEGAAGLVAVGTGQLLSGPNIYKFTYNAGFTAWVVTGMFLQAADIPTGIDATKLSDGSVTNTEFQYISTLTSNAQDQINGKSSTSHTHALDDLSDVTLTTPAATQFLKFTGTGNASANGAIAAGDLPTGIDAAKLHDGSIGNADLVCIKDLATTGGTGHVLKQETVGGPVTSGTVSATDSTKLALDGSNDMSANISFSGEVAATGGSTREIGFNSAGGFINAPTGDVVDFTINGASKLTVSGTYSLSDQPMLWGTCSRNAGGFASQVHTNGSSGAIIAESLSGQYSAIVSGGAPATTIPGYHAYGTSHANNGALISRAGRKSHAADATWRDHVDLSYVRASGAAVLVTDNSGSFTWYSINYDGTTITFVRNNGANYWGSEDSTHKHLRISGGKIQVYCGTGLSTSEVGIHILE